MKHLCYRCHREDNSDFYKEKGNSINQLLQELTAKSPPPSSSAESTISDAPPRNKGGRPKGTTDANKESQKRAKISATNFVVVKYSEAQRLAKANNITVDRGLRASLVKEAKELFNVEDENFGVSKQLIQNRIDRGNLLVEHRGVVAPLAAVEVSLITYILSAARIGAPLAVGEVIQLMDSLIRGTVWERLYVEYKKQHHIYEEGGTICRSRMVQRI
jgi:hypothetical protein